MRIGRSSSLHPYTKALINVMPKPQLAGKKKQKRQVLKGETPNPGNIPKGCRFHTRCPFAEERCKVEEPSLIQYREGHSLSSKCQFLLKSSRKELYSNEWINRTYAIENEKEDLIALSKYIQQNPELEKPAMQVFKSFMRLSREAWIRCAKRRWRNWKTAFVAHFKKGEGRGFKLHSALNMMLCRISAMHADII